MKLIIEINDDHLRHAIDTQVAKVIAQIASESIQKQVDEILAVKFGRVNDAMLEKAVGIAAANYVRGNGTAYQIESRVNGVLAAAARELVREQSRRL